MFANAKADDIVKLVTNHGYADYDAEKRNKKRDQNAELDAPMTLDGASMQPSGFAGLGGGGDGARANNDRFSFSSGASVSDFSHFVRPAFEPKPKKKKREAKKRKRASRSQDNVPQFMKRDAERGRRSGASETEPSSDAARQIEAMFGGERESADAAVERELAAAAASLGSGPAVVRHPDASSSASGAADKALAAIKPSMRIFYQCERPLSIREMHRINCKRNHNITLTEMDEIDLDNTSCEELENDPFDPLSDGFYSDIDSTTMIGPVPRNYDIEEEADRYFRKQDDDDDLSDGDLSSSDENSCVTKVMRTKRKRVCALRRARMRSDDSSRQKRKKRRLQAGQSVASEIGKTKHCFLCSWGRYDYDSVNNSQMRELLSLIFDNIGEIDTKTIARSVHQYYTKIMIPTAQCNNQYLPPWRSKDVFLCIEEHNFHPEIKLVRDISDMAVLKNYTKGHLGHIVKDETGKERDIPNPDMMKIYKDTIKTQYQLYNLKTPSMNFHRQSRNVKLGNDQRSFRSVKLRLDSKRKITALK